MVKLAHSMVSAAEMNFNRIQTWSGSVTVRRVEIRKKFDLKTESTASIDFHYDRSSGRSQSRCKVIDWKASRTLEASPISTRGHQGGWLWTPQSSYSLMLDDYSSGRPRIVRVSSADKQPVPKPSVYRPERFHPLMFFQEPGSHRGASGDLKMLAGTLPAAIAQQAVINFRSDEPGVLECEVVSESSGLRMIRKYDQSVGGNPVMQKVELDVTPERREKGVITLRWKNVDGIWLPRKWTCDREYDAFGARVDHLSVEWTSQAVNEPLPEEAFTLEFLGVQAGDTLLNGEARSIYGGSNSDQPETP